MEYEDYYKSLKWCQNMFCEMNPNDYRCDIDEFRCTQEERNLLKLNKVKDLKYITVSDRIAIGKCPGHSWCCNNCRCYDGDVDTIKKYKLHHHKCTSQSFCPGGGECYRNGSLKIKK